MYFYPTNRLCRTMPFIIRTCLLLSLSLFFYNHYLLYKVSLCHGVLISSDLPLCNRYNSVFTYVGRLTKYC